jgi:hypothetical protein
LILHPHVDKFNSRSETNLFFKRGEFYFNNTA